MKNNRYINNDSGPNKDAIYRDAWRIADPGASNPVAVAGTLREASSALLQDIGTDGVRKHPALRLMAAQLAFLYSVNCDGGGSHYDDRFIDEVKVYVELLDKESNNG